MELEKLKTGEIYYKERKDYWAAEQWTGAHWTLLQIKPTKKELDFWLDYVWKRPNIDTTASD